MVVLFTLFMVGSFASEPMSLPLVLFLTGIIVIAIGMVVATIRPVRRRWGLRLVAFVISVAYLWYLAYYIFTPQSELGSFSSRADPTLFNSILGFFIIAIPSGIYTLAGEGRPRTEKDDLSASVFNIVIAKTIAMAMRVYVAAYVVLFIAMIVKVVLVLIH